MKQLLYLTLIFIVPWIGTTLGSAGVFFLRRQLSNKIQKLILGFASGVMIAALFWSLLLPAIESDGIIPAIIGFSLGIVVLLLFDNITPHLHLDSDRAEGPRSKLGKSALLIFAIILHNIPEGLAVGSSAGVLVSDGMDFSFAGVVALSIGIALQNVPEGLVVALPLYEAGHGKLKAFIQGSLSGVVEPIASVLAFFLIGGVSSLLPYLLSFAAGAMFYVVLEELVPETARGDHSNLGVLGSSIGFVLMMILDGIF